MVVSTSLFDLSLNATFSERLSSDTRPEACLCPSCPFLVLFVWKATDLGQPDRILGLPLPSGVSQGTCLTSPKACFLIPPVGIHSTAWPPSAGGPERAHEYGILEWLNVFRRRHDGFMKLGESSGPGECQETVRKAQSLAQKKYLFLLRQ